MLYEQSVASVPDAFSEATGISHQAKLDLNADALLQKPDDVALIMERCSILRDMWRLPEAVAAYTKPINNMTDAEGNPKAGSDPKLLSVLYFERGKTHYAKSKIEGLNTRNTTLAAEDFQKCVKLDPENYYAYIGLSQASEYFNDRRVIAKSVEKAIALRPECSLAYIQRAALNFNHKDLHGRLDPSSAIADLKKALHLRNAGDQDIMEVDWKAVQRSHDELINPKPWADIFRKPG